MLRLFLETSVFAEVRSWIEQLVRSAKKNFCDLVQACPPKSLARAGFALPDLRVQLRRPLARRRRLNRGVEAGASAPHKRRRCIIVRRRRSRHRRRRRRRRRRRPHRFFRFPSLLAADDNTHSSVHGLL